jgi:hypothetical protein
VDVVKPSKTFTLHPFSESTPSLVPFEECVSKTTRLVQTHHSSIQIVLHLYAAAVWKWLIAGLVTLQVLD